MKYHAIIAYMLKQSIPGLNVTATYSTLIIKVLQSRRCIIAYDARVRNKWPVACQSALHSLDHTILQKKFYICCRIFL